VKQNKEAINPRLAWGVSRARIDSVKAGLNFRRHLVQQVKAGRYGSFREAALEERSRFLVR